MFLKTIRSSAFAAMTTSMLLVGASVGEAAAMPANPAIVARAASEAVVPASYHLHRRYPGYHSRAARAYRSMRRNTPNRYCQNAPSRCR